MASVVPVIGKDIIELVSSAMYDNPLAIFREYVQNAADAIDDAYVAGSLSATRPGRIDITLDLETRTIRIRDNGIGIAAGDALGLLTAFGASKKRGTGARGFRGIGRFAALGYAQMVTFKTRKAGESVTSEIRWDCRKLKAALVDRAYDGDLVQLVRDTVSTSLYHDPEAPAAFFEVTLERVVRIKNDLLLNGDAVERYLSETAPVPFHRDFPFGTEIRARLGRLVPEPRFLIFLNKSSQPVTRPHHSEFYVSKTKSDRALSIEFFEVANGEGGLRALGWLLHHNYLGALHASPEIRGLRARLGDIQIGDESVFAEIFREPRFSSWTVGEIHLFDPKLLPNSRRDAFERNRAYSDLVAQLVPLARLITAKCRAGSAIRNRLKTFKHCATRLSYLLDVLSTQLLTRRQDSRIQHEIESIFSRLETLEQSSMLGDTDKKRIRAARSRFRAKFEAVEEPADRGDPLEEMPVQQRAVYSKIIELVIECSPNKIDAQALVSRIKRRLLADKKHSRGENRQRHRVTRRPRLK